MRADKRNYDASLREAQSDQTRRRVVDAAAGEFIRLGYAATSMSSIARAAGVSRETVYHLVGGKAAVLKAVYDATVVGDHRDVAAADRDEYRAMLTDPDRRRAAGTFGRLSAQLLGRLAPILALLADAASDPELNGLLAQTREERLAGTRHLLAALSGADPATAAFARAVDEVYAYISPELALVLVEQRRWALSEYGDWLGEQVARQVAELAAGGSPSGNSTGASAS